MKMMLVSSSHIFSYLIAVMIPNQDPLQLNPHIRTFFPDYRLKHYTCCIFVFSSPSSITRFSTMLSVIFFSWSESEIHYLKLMLDAPNLIKSRNLRFYDRST